MVFRDGTLTDTDYWTCDQGALANRAWLAVEGTTWHLMVPSTDAGMRIRQAVALPVIARSHETGWQWAIVSKRRELDVRVSHDSIIGTPPPLPQPGAWLQRELMVYSQNPFFHLPPVQYNFGHFQKGEVPILFGCTLEVVRPRRAKDGLHFAGVIVPWR